MNFQKFKICDFWWPKPGLDLTGLCSGPFLKSRSGCSGNEFWTHFEEEAPKGLKNDPGSGPARVQDLKKGSKNGSFLSHFFDQKWVIF